MKRSKKENLWILAVTVAMGMAVAVVGYYYFLKMAAWPPVLKAALVGLIFALTTAATAGIIVGVVCPCLSRLTLRESVVCISLGLCCGWGLVLVIPVMPPLGLMPEHWLQVTATGEKNPLSKSPDVWVVGLLDRRTRQFVANAYDFQQHGNWHALTPQLIFTQVPGTLTWNGRVTSAVVLKIYASWAAGKVRIVWDGKEQLLDLYAPAHPAIPKTILLELSPTPDYWTPKRTFVSLCAAAGMAFPLIVVFLWFVSRSPGPAVERRCPSGAARLSGLAWLGYGLPLLVAGAGYLSVFPPALMSNDSLNQWMQMLCGTYSDWHPAFHTMTNWLITRIWFSPAAVAWTQLIAMGLVVAWTLKRLRQWGLSRPLACTASGLVAIMPAAGILCITLWKDIPYTIGFLLVALWVMEIVQSRGQWLERPASALVLGVVLALVAIYRHNGLPVALGTPLFLAAVYYRQAFRLALALLVACAVIWGVRGPLYQAVAARACVGNQPGDWHKQCAWLVQGLRRYRPYNRSVGVWHAFDGRRAKSLERAPSLGKWQVGL